MKEGITAKVRAAGGEIYAISSEPQALAGRSTTDWRLDFESLGDPHHEISGTCRARGWLDLFVNEQIEFLERSTDPSLGWSPSHPKGFFQPGVLVLRQDGRVLYRWRSVPTRKNMGGAVERPTATHVWSAIAAALEGEANATDAALDKNPTLDSRGIPWPLFASLLIANGWFLGARGLKSARHILTAAARLIGFAGAWAAAFVWLPTLPVALALAAWGVFITPKVRSAGREFQDVSGG